MPTLRSAPTAGSSFCAFAPPPPRRCRAAGMAACDSRQPDGGFFRLPPAVPNTQAGRAARQGESLSRRLQRGCREGGAGGLVQHSKTSSALPAEGAFRPGAASRTRSCQPVTGAKTGRKTPPLPTPRLLPLAPAIAPVRPPAARSAAPRPPQKRRQPPRIPAAPSRPAPRGSARPGPRRPIPRASRGAPRRRSSAGPAARCAAAPADSPRSWVSCRRCGRRTA